MRLVFNATDPRKRDQLWLLMFPSQLGLPKVEDEAPVELALSGVWDLGLDDPKGAGERTWECVEMRWKAVDPRAQFLRCSGTFDGFPENSDIEEPAVPIVDRLARLDYVDGSFREPRTPELYLAKYNEWSCGKPLPEIGEDGLVWCGLCWASRRLGILKQSLQRAKTRIKQIDWGYVTVWTIVWLMLGTSGPIWIWIIAACTHRVICLLGGPR